MRKLIIFTLFINAFPLFSQNAMTHKENTSPLSNTQRPATFEDYLVQIAWQNSPELEGQKYEIDVRKQEIQLAKKDWTRNMVGGFNFNDVSLDIPLISKPTPQVATYPLWNVGLGVSFGDLYMRKNKINYADNRRKISEADMNLKKQKIKGEILRRYQEYLGAIEVFKVRIQALDVAQSNKTQMENLFAVNKVQFEDLNQANKTYFDSMEAKLKGESEIKVRKISLEELLGVKWETLERVKASYDEKKN